MLGPVTGLKQTAQDAGGTTFVWNADQYADAYAIDVDGVASGEITLDTAEVSGVAPGNHVLGVAPVADPTPVTTLAFTVPAPPPATPTGLQVPAATITDTTAVVTCNPSAGATEYGLSVDGAWLTPQAGTTWNLNGLAPGVQHVVTVDAGDAAGTSPPSAPVTFNTLPAPGPPATPVGLQVPPATITQTTAVVSCMATPNADTYGLELDGVLLPQQASPTWPLTGLEPDSMHTVTVDASNAEGTSDPSAPVTFTTANPVSPPPSSGGLDPVLVLAGVGVLAAIGIAVGHGGKHLPKR